MTWNELTYLERPPTVTSERAPLLLLLHGYGSNEADLFGFVTYLPEHYHVISLQAPYTLGPQSFAWYAINFDAEKGKFSDEKQARSSRDLIHQFIGHICTEKHLNRDNVTLLGFSQGAILSYAIAFTYPKTIQQVIALSGYCNESLMPEDWQLQNLDGLSIYAAHGKSDAVIPINWAQQSAALLRSVPDLKFEFQEFDMGHAVSQESFADMMRWMNSL